jgi:D-alanine--poly(phosphoribitol) ligase subunit 1
LNNVISYLETSANSFPQKLAYVDEESSVTFAQLRIDARALATQLLGITQGEINVPAVVLMKKSVNCITAFMGVSYSGGFYTPLDVTSPLPRLQKIIETLQPKLIVTTAEFSGLARSLGFSKENTVLIEDAVNYPADKAKIDAALARKIDTDPLYILFTSGSTGIPKGVTICHRSVIDYMEWVCETFQIDENTRFGNQAPFYFDNSILDIYCTLKTGASMYIVPEKLFIFPIKLIEYLNSNQINTIFWVPSALIYVANSKVFEKLLPQQLEKVLFCGEVMPNKQLNIWRKALPDAVCANLYGPTEITDVCTYFIVDREMSDEEPLPIGYPCRNTGILVLNEQNQAVTGEEIGELCVRGTSLSLGYYNNPEKTKEAFVQNPLNSHYPELIYRTGDLVKYNDRQELIYLCRRDFQIKHMGHRIEIGEIETAVLSLPGIENGCIVYDDRNSKIVLFYESDSADDASVLLALRGMLPKYMLPNKLVHLDRMPVNPNGKIDRVKLKESML